MTTDIDIKILSILVDRIAASLEWLADGAADDRIKVMAKQIAMDAATFRNKLEETDDVL